MTPTDEITDARRCMARDIAWNYGVAVRNWSAKPGLPDGPVPKALLVYVGKVVARLCLVPMLATLSGVPENELLAELMGGLNRKETGNGGNPPASH
jgi:hypothetical protein